MFDRPSFVYANSFKDAITSAFRTWFVSKASWYSRKIAA